MKKLSFISMVLAVAASASTADPARAAGNCDALRSQIEAKIAASGVAHFAVTVVDAGAVSGTFGKVVGSCEMGGKSIIYQRPDASDMPGTAGTDRGTSDAVPRSKKGAILTECKDGSVLVGGECKN